MTAGTIQVTAIASGEIRDADGNLKERVNTTQVFEVALSELVHFSDEQLKAAGLPDEQIAQIALHRNEDQS